jgi:ATP synthase protein I
MNEQQGGQPQTFEQRLRAARERQGLEPKPPKQAEDQGGEPSVLAVGLRLALELVVALVVACAIGWGLDQLLGTRPIFLIAFVPLGAAAGILNVWRTFAPDRDKPGRKW